MTSPKLKLVPDEPMTPQHLRFCLSRLGWDHYDLAEHIDESYVDCMSWWAGGEPVPTVVKRYLELRLKLKELSDA